MMGGRCNVMGGIIWQNQDGFRHDLYLYEGLIYLLTYLMTLINITGVGVRPGEKPTMQEQAMRRCLCRGAQGVPTPPKLP